MNQELLISELRFKAIRSGGPGGQHANKVSSKVQLLFDIVNSNALTEDEKYRITKKLSKNITKEGFLKLASETSRSQHENKVLVINRFLKIIEKALQLPKKRKSTKPPKSSVEKRLKSKNKTSEKKANRRKPNTN